MNKKVLFVIFGSRDLIDSFKQNKNQYPSDKNSIELNNYDDLRTQIEFIHEDSDMSHKEYIVLHVNEYDVDILDYIVDEVKNLKYLTVKFLVLSDGNSDDEEIDDIQELAHSINKLKGKVESGSRNKPTKNSPSKIGLSEGEKELDKLISSSDVMINLDSLNYLIDVARNFDKSRDNMHHELENSILCSLLMMSIKLEENNEKLLEENE